VRQVGHVSLGPDGLARRDLIVRHLAMPGMLEDARRIYDWIAQELGVDTYVNILPQYAPRYRTERHPKIDRRTTAQEWHDAMALARLAGLRNLHPHPVPAPSREQHIRERALLSR